MTSSTRIIASRTNPLFRRFRKAIDDHTSEIVIEGLRAIDDALALGFNPLAIVCREDREQREGCHALSKALFHSLSDTVTSQGVIGLFPRPQTTLSAILDHAQRIIVALDGVQDPGNVGTIVRLAAAFDAGGLITLDGTADPWSQKCLRSSAGTMLQVPVAQTTRQELIASARSRGLKIYAAIRGGNDDAQLEEPGIVVFGSEGRGVSSEIEQAALPVSVAMSTRVESLNVAAAAAILLSRAYESRS